MTICIGTICEQSKIAIAVADRMITGPDIEFEHDTCKLEPLPGNCVGLTAGSALAHTELFKAVVEDMSGRSAPLVDEVTKAVKKAFGTIRRREIDETVLGPLGLNMESFMGLQRQLDADLVMRLARQIEMHSLDLDILVIGADRHGAHIHYISNPGTSECYNALGFCAIGSGERHAESTLILRNYSPQMPVGKALYLAYEAKRSAEVAPGVGKFTDIAILHGGGVRWLEPERVRELDKMYEMFKSSYEGMWRSIQATAEKLSEGLGINGAT